MSGTTLIKRLLPKNRFARSVSVLAGGTAAGQGIVILASPFLTRLYSPEDFGLLAVFAALLGIFAVVASLRYELAIPLPESDQEAAHVVVLCLLTVMGVTAASAGIVFFFSQSIAVLLNTPALDAYLWLLPVGVFLVGVYQAFSYWAIRTNAFPAIARTKLAQSISMIGVQLGAYSLGPLALLVGRVFGQAAGTTSLGALAIRKCWPIFKTVRPAGVRRAAARYKRFPIYSTWAGGFNTAGRELPPLLFAALFSASAAGIYMLAHRVLAMPMTLIGKAIADVFFSKAAEAKRNGELAPLVATIHGRLTQIAMPPALILFLSGPELFVFVFGEQWRQAGEFAQWMVPWVYLVFVTSPLSTLCFVMDKQAQDMMFQGALIIIRLISLFAAAIWGGLTMAVALFAIGSALCWFGFLIWLMHSSGNPLKLAWRPSFSALAVSSLLVTPLVAFYVLEQARNYLFLATAVTTTALAIYYFRMMKKAW